MPIRPIDLQTMLMQLSQVGREQSAGKEGLALQGAMKNAADQKKLDETKESVHRAEDEEVATRAVGDRGGGEEGAAPGEEGGAKEGGKTGKDGEVVKDPDLGTRIDLQG